MQHLPESLGTQNQVVQPYCQKQAAQHYLRTWTDSEGKAAVHGEDQPIIVVYTDLAHLLHDADMRMALAAKARRELLVPRMWLEKVTWKVRFRLGELLLCGFLSPSTRPGGGQQQKTFTDHACICCFSVLNRADSEDMSRFYNVCSWLLRMAKQAVQHYCPARARRPCSTALEA